MSNEKFRPYLTSQDLQLILGSLKQTCPDLARGLIRYLETFAIKIERGVINPQLTLQPTIEQKLGLTGPSDSDEISPERLYAMATAYEMFPDQRNKFSPRQLAAIQQYRFLHDRMTQIEEAQYVQSLQQAI
mgnify:CR=1 FL=1